MVRKAVFAGKFYPEDEFELKKMIDYCLKTHFGPLYKDNGNILIDLENKKITGIISPHAGYVFSCSCSSYGYLALKKEVDNSNVESIIFVILGVNHTGLGNSGISKEDFETPFGLFKNNIIIGKKINEICNIPFDERVHKFEHSIEVQLPLIQYFLKEYDISLVPIVVDYDANFDLLGKALVKIRKSLTKYQKLVVVASSDFTHYGIDYGYMPFGENAPEKVRRDDLETIKIILNKDVKEFDERMKSRTVCGRFTIKSLLHYINWLEKDGLEIDGKLLSYYQSREIYPNESFVGYASIVFYIK